MSQPPSDYQVRNPEIETTLRGLGRAIKEVMPLGWGFTLLLFDYTHDNGDTGALFYLSSANRDEMCKAMREFLTKQEGQVQ